MDETGSYVVSATPAVIRRTGASPVRCHLCVVWLALRFCCSKFRHNVPSKRLPRITPYFSPLFSQDEAWEQRTTQKKTRDDHFWFSGS